MTTHEFVVGLVIRQSVVAIALVASGRNVRIEVPEGGHFESHSGAFSCESGQTCDIEIVDLLFDETFEAIPQDGYYIRKWDGGDHSLCGSTYIREGEARRWGYSDDGKCYLQEATWYSNRGHDGTRIQDDEQGRLAFFTSGRTNFSTAKVSRMIIPGLKIGTISSCSIRVPGSRYQPTLQKFPLSARTRQEN